MDYQNSDQKIIIHLGDRLDKEFIEEQKKILKNVLESRKPIIFDAKQLTRVDTASLQLLISFTLTASQEGIKWNWLEPTDSLKKMSRLLGMSELLRLPEK